jgi:hypothetical protein
VTFLIGAANHSVVSASYLVFAVFTLTSLLLTIGLFTPVLSVTACLFGVANLVIGPQSRNLIWGVFTPSILTAGALAFLGPGAYSLDARLFGRRVMIVPPAQSKVSGSRESDS